MYKYIKGQITELGPNYVVLECNNIGYLIYVANPFSYEVGKEYKIYLYNNVKEDENSLYGFKSEEELNLFLKLINVKGLGPKMANTFFAMGSVNGIVDAINRENILYLTKFPKIGEKIAKQMILDLKGKVTCEAVVEEENSTEDLVAVLESLGYKTLEIKKILKDIDNTLPIESQVKEALKLLLK
ncbi:MAG: Holliday junction branch migration protein RuvA [Firmicutes bacterium]|nr:Holliday junction branch migration protein RuvA [Bacillota bacterium]